ncbi:MAG: PilZ domain-containing protein [Myxococcota bacterium]
MQVETELSQNVRAERRLALRVPVRVPVRAAVGLRAFEAELVDLSVTGCRIRCAQPVTAHGSIWVLLPAGLGGRVPMPVRGEVARAESVRGEPTGVCDVALRFRSLSPRAYERVCAVVREALEPQPEPEPERRRAPRRWFGRRVIARGAGRPRVLLGRDLSAGGMRVENAQGLAAGDVLQLALHSHAGEVPLVVTARVLRMDEAGDAALGFLNLTAAQLDALAKTMAELGRSDDGVPLVSELLEPSPRLDKEA